MKGMEEMNDADAINNRGCQVKITTDFKHARIVGLVEVNEAPFIIKTTSFPSHVIRFDSNISDGSD